MSLDSPTLVLDPTNRFLSKPSAKLLSETDTVHSSLPKLEIYHALGEGSTGQVFAGRWKHADVAVKISSCIDSRRRLLVEASHYISLQTQSRVSSQQLQLVLPRFMGWYRCHNFDVLILSAEGRPCGNQSWLTLTQGQRCV
jgi:hypothetical protein